MRGVIGLQVVHQSLQIAQGARTGRRADAFSVLLIRNLAVDQALSTIRQASCRSPSLARVVVAAPPRSDVPSNFATPMIVEVPSGFGRG